MVFETGKLGSGPWHRKGVWQGAVAGTPLWSPGLIAQGRPQGHKTWLCPQSEGQRLEVAAASPAYRSSLSSTIPTPDLGSATGTWHGPTAMLGYQGARRLGLLLPASCCLCQFQPCCQLGAWAAAWSPWGPARLLRPPAAAPASWPGLSGATARSLPSAQGRQSLAWR